jgi:DNA polymerase sigma
MWDFPFYNTHQLQRGVNNGAAFLFLGLYTQYCLLLSDLNRHIFALFLATGILGVFKLKAKARLLPFEFIHDKAFKFSYIVVKSSAGLFSQFSVLLLNH